MATVYEGVHAAHRGARVDVDAVSVKQVIDLAVAAGASISEHDTLEDGLRIACRRLEPTGHQAQLDAALEAVFCGAHDLGFERPHENHPNAVDELARLAEWLAAKNGEDVKRGTFEVVSRAKLDDVRIAAEVCGMAPIRAESPDALLTRVAHTLVLCTTRKRVEGNGDFGDDVPLIVGRRVAKEMLDAAKAFGVVVSKEGLFDVQLEAIGRWFTDAVKARPPFPLVEGLARDRFDDLVRAANEHGSTVVVGDRPTYAVSKVIDLIRGLGAERNEAAAKAAATVATCVNCPGKTCVPIDVMDGLYEAAEKALGLDLSGERFDNDPDVDDPHEERVYLITTALDKVKQEARVGAADPPDEDDDEGDEAEGDDDREGVSFGALDDLYEAAREAFGIELDHEADDENPDDEARVEALTKALEKVSASKARPVSYPALNELVGVARQAFGDDFGEEKRSYDQDLIALTACLQKQDPRGERLTRSILRNGCKMAASTLTVTARGTRNRGEGCQRTADAHKEAGRLLEWATAKERADTYAVVTGELEAAAAELLRQSAEHETGAGQGGRLERKPYAETVTFYDSVDGPPPPARVASASIQPNGACLPSEYAVIQRFSALVHEARDALGSVPGHPVDDTSDALTRMVKLVHACKAAREPHVVGVAFGPEPGKAVALEASQPFSAYFAVVDDYVTRAYEAIGREGTPVAMVVSHDVRDRMMCLLSACEWAAGELRRARAERAELAAVRENYERLHGLVDTVSTDLTNAADALGDVGVHRSSCVDLGSASRYLVEACREAWGRLQRPSFDSYARFVRHTMQQSPNERGIAAAVAAAGNPATAPALWALGFAGEAGEVCNAVKKACLYGRIATVEDVEKIADELGDALWYWATVAESCDLVFEVIVAKNMAKVRAKFPQMFHDDGSFKAPAGDDR